MSVVDHAYAVIMAGGSGTRFWPVSRNARPKQLTRILADATMIQATVARLHGLFAPERILVVTTAAIAAETRRQLPMLPAANIVAEPVGRDTAPCVCLAAHLVEAMDPQAVMTLLTADALISPVDGFQRTLRAGMQVAAAGGLVTYGIAPRAPSTAYGHIQQGAALPPVDGIAVHRVQRFVEKPDLATAERYTASGEYRWNSGMFTWRADVVLGELGRHCGWLTEALRPVRSAWGTPGFEAALASAYGPLKKISIDYALMEHAADVKVVSAAFDWDDVGSWDAVLDNLPRDAAGVATRGQALTLDCRDCLAVNEGGPLVALAGLEGIIAIATPDAVLVCRRGGSQQVKQVVEALKTAKRNDLL